MEPEYFEWGAPAARDALVKSEAIAFISAVQKHAGARLLRFLKDADNEGVEFEIPVTIPQRPAAVIRKHERICVIFGMDPHRPPVVLALRRDFPNLSHSTLVSRDDPVSLCLDAREFEEARLSSTPELFLCRIASWLRRAAHGELQAQDEHLEPFLLQTEAVIVDPDLFDPSRLDVVLQLVSISNEPYPLYRLVEAVQSRGSQKERPLLRVYLRAPLWCSQAITRCPTTLAELCEILRRIGINMIDVLRCFVKEIRDLQDHAKLMSCRCMLIVALPKTRSPQAKPESFDFWLVFIETDMSELGCHLGILEKHGRDLGSIIGEVEASGLENIPVRVTVPFLEFNRPMARLMADVKTENNPHIAAIGAGALGSQVALNLARQGIGKWTIVDKDRLLPHNLARHGLLFGSVGMNKAHAVAQEIQRLLHDPEAAKGCAVDVHRLGDRDEPMEIIRQADLIYDFSISSAVARRLARIQTSAPRTSAFLIGDQGCSLVILSEGTTRSVRIDDLEFQLAAESLGSADLSNLFRSSGAGIRYGGGCSDITAILAQDHLAIHAGIAARFLRDNQTASEPSINVWSRADDLTFSRTTVRASPITVHDIGKWTVRLTDLALDAMRYLRLQHLPNETGGILLGMVDFAWNTIYVCSILPSPPDSDECPWAYIRGTKGLPQRLQAIEEQTSGLITYVGEWHSHPEGCGASPSPRDREAHKWLKSRMAETGHPGLILIVGEAEPFLMLD